MGDAKFVDSNTLEVNGQQLKFLKCCIATGGRPKIPNIDGLEKVRYHSSENIFNLTKLPKSMFIIGSGPVGCELGQGFQRLGTQVTMSERGSHFLPREDQDAAAILQEQMKKDGVNVLFDT
jgi:pyruvate/2-oxoglutarate dehydrogenase complex dihydrolipoamide dehydrogenase (E3) component